jgi:hypothetical protein
MPEKGEDGFCHAFRAFVGSVEPRGTAHPGHGLPRCVHEVSAAAEAHAAVTAARVVHLPYASRGDRRRPGEVPEVRHEV